MVSVQHTSSLLCPKSSTVHAASLAYLVPLQGMQQFTITCIIHQHSGSNTCHQLRPVCAQQNSSCRPAAAATGSANQRCGYLLTWLEAQIIAYVAYAILLRLQGSNTEASEQRCADVGVPVLLCLCFAYRRLLPGYHRPHAES